MRKVAIDGSKRVDEIVLDINVCIVSDSIGIIEEIR